MSQPRPRRGTQPRTNRNTVNAEQQAPQVRCACLQDDAAAAVTAIQANSTEKGFLNESHFKISLQTCRKCRQAFLYVMTEMVDWANGEDPIARVYFPVSPEQATTLRDIRPKSYGDLQPLKLKGPYLVTYWPSEGPHLVAWRTGVLPCFPHD